MDLQRAMLESGLEVVASLLDERADARIRELWADLERQFGLKGIYSAPYPHFSYHGAAEYRSEVLGATLERHAASTRVFRICTSGLGIFRGERPVIYLPVVRGPSLHRLHALLWPDLCERAQAPNLNYSPDHYLPHITLAYGDLTDELLPEVVRYLAEQAPYLESDIDNVALLYTKGPDQGVSLRFPLAAAEPRSA